MLPHERTTPKAKSDRLDLTRATKANISPIWGLSLATGLSDLLSEPGELVGQYTDNEGVLHMVERVSEPADITTPKSLRLAGNKTVLFEVKAKASAANGTKQITATYRVTNLLIGPDEPLTVTLPFETIIAIESKN